MKPVGKNWLASQPLKAEVVFKRQKDAGVFHSCSFPAGTAKYLRKGLGWSPRKIICDNLLRRCKCCSPSLNYFWLSSVTGQIACSIDWDHSGRFTPRSHCTSRLQPRCITAPRRSTGFCSASVHSHGDDSIDFLDDKPAAPRLSRSVLGWLWRPKRHLVPESHTKPSALSLTFISVCFISLALRHWILSKKA